MWYNGIYRHPERQKSATTHVRRNMGHDIYSLGVCLLEIGLWESLMYEVWVHDEKSSYNKENMAEKATMPTRLAQKLNLGSGNEARRKAVYELLKTDEGPSHVEKKLIEVALEELPQRTRTSHAELVKSCLTCLDNQAGGSNHTWKIDFADE